MKILSEKGFEARKENNTEGKKYHERKHTYNTRKRSL